MAAHQSTPLTIIANNNNHKGDLFTRLMNDLFFALGYKDLQVDVAKSGREIDIQGIHKTEQRGVRAECKALKTTVGGDVINKMRGALMAERANSDLPLCAYVVSLNGFTATAIEQEQNLSAQDRAILIDNLQIVSHLTSANIVNKTKAIEQAGRLAQHHHLNAQIAHIELLGHELGYLWAVYYSHNKLNSHIALIHADGTPLDKTLSQQIDLNALQADNPLTLLTPPSSSQDNSKQLKQTQALYCQWLSKECGEIHLDGLPADADLSTYSLELEKLFVPLKLKHVVKSQVDSQEKTKETITPVGEYFTSNPQFALLAKPGGGKSTLLKRIAVAYADKTRFNKVADNLPQRHYLPLLLRCRDLKTRADRPIIALINDLATTACLNQTQQQHFIALIEQQLNHGQILLLIDGLDEIADQSLRATFASNLRTFMATFPQVALIITSREAGYRHVASVIASSCPQVTMADFDRNDVTNLCVRWHQAVIGDDDIVSQQAEQLATTIWENDRVRALAENPLMLTTLLVIKRCIGELPTKRVELYRQAVEVLIRTWNTQGFAAMDLDEALAQLCFVACAMMENGSQRIGHKQLIKWLQQARQTMPAELGYCDLSPAQFVERIEYRSSLLMRVGSEDIDGTMQYVYEFRHLTFQEYLTARGLVEYGYPECQGPKNIVEQLQPHLDDDSFKQVIPLAAVMAKSKAAPLIDHLNQQLSQAPFDDEALNYQHPAHRQLKQYLLQCLLDEVQIPPKLVTLAITQACRGDESNRGDSYKALYKGKFAAIVNSQIQELIVNADNGYQYFNAFYVNQKIELEKLLSNTRTDIKTDKKTAKTLDSTPVSTPDSILIPTLAKQLNADLSAQISSLFKMGILFYDDTHSFTDIECINLYKQINQLLHSINPQQSNINLSQLWAIALALNWLLDKKHNVCPTTTNNLRQLLTLAAHCPIAAIASGCCLIFIQHQPLNQDAFCQNQRKLLVEYYQQLQQLAQASPSNGLKQQLTLLKLTLSWYRCFDISDSELITQIEQLIKREGWSEKYYASMLKQLKGS